MSFSDCANATEEKIENATTSATTTTAAAPTVPPSPSTFAAIASNRWQPALRTLPPYYDDPIHIDALAASLTVGEIEAFRRTGAVAQLTITLASLPALDRRSMLEAAE